MSNAFPPPTFPPPPPPSPDHESTPLVPVVSAHHVAWPKKKWLKLPLWAWIAVGALTVGSVAVVAGSGGKQPQSTGSRTESTDVSETTSVTETTAITETTPVTETTAVSETVATVPETAAPTTPAPTAPPFTLPTATSPPVTAAPETVPAVSTRTDRDAFVDWVVREDLYSLSNELLASLDPIIAAAEAYDWDGIGIACAAAHDVNERMAATLPSPSPEMNTALTDMTEDFDMALHFCQDGSAAYDSALLTESSEYMNRAAQHAQEVTEILNTI